MNYSYDIDEESPEFNKTKFQEANFGNCLDKLSKNSYRELQKEMEFQLEFTPFDKKSILVSDELDNFIIDLYKESSKKSDKVIELIKHYKNLFLDYHRTKALIDNPAEIRNAMIYTSKLTTFMMTIHKTLAYKEIDRIFRDFNSSPYMDIDYKTFNEKEKQKLLKISGFKAILKNVTLFDKFHFLNELYYSTGDKINEYNTAINSGVYHVTGFHFSGTDKQLEQLHQQLLSNDFIQKGTRYEDFKQLFTKNIPNTDFSKIVWIDFNEKNNQIVKSTLFNLFYLLKKQNLFYNESIDDIIDDPFKNKNLHNGLYRKIEAFFKNLSNIKNSDTHKAVYNTARSRILSTIIENL